MRYWRLQAVAAFRARCRIGVRLRHTSLARTLDSTLSRSVSMFEQAVAQLRAHCETCQHNKSGGLEPSVVTEVLKRLAQMDRILTMVRSLDAESGAIVAGIAEYARTEQGDPPPPELWHRTSAIGRDVEMLTEAFYYFAFRFREVVRRIPGFANFDAVGVRDVRNHLIEHPERTSKVLGGSFKHGGPEGPVLKPIRSEAQKDVSLDRGLFVNAAEMRDELQRRLARVSARDHSSERP